MSTKNIAREAGVCFEIRILNLPNMHRYFLTPYCNVQCCCRDLAFCFLSPRFIYCISYISCRGNFPESKAILQWKWLPTPWAGIEWVELYLRLVILLYPDVRVLYTGVMMLYPSVMMLYTGVTYVYAYRKYYVPRCTYSHICTAVISNFDKSILWSVPFKTQTHDNCQPKKGNRHVSSLLPWLSILDHGEYRLYFCSLSFSSQVWTD